MDGPIHICRGTSAEIVIIARKQLQVLPTFDLLRNAGLVNHLQTWLGPAIKFSMD